MGLELMPGYGSAKEVRALFSEYTQLLVAGDPSFQEYLDIQHYDDELAHLEKKYGLPEGRLYLALWDGKPAGCIGLRKLDGHRCEMKRLYVRPAFRERHIGSALVQRIVADAREIGYAQMLLDTFPFLERAIAMYRAMGFYEIARYSDSPLDSTIYMCLDL